METAAKLRRATVVTTSLIGMGISILMTDSQAAANLERIGVAEEQLEVAETSLADLRQELGATCVRFLEAYAPGGPLAQGRSVSGAEITRDLVLHNEKPCGTDPFKVSSAQERYSDATGQIDSLEEAIEDLEFFFEKWPITRHWPETAAGFLLGSFAALIHLDHEDQKKRKQQA